MVGLWMLSRTVPTSPLVSCGRGPAKISVGAFTLVIRPKFDSPASSGANIDPDSTARAPAPLPSAFEHPPSPVLLATVSLSPVPAVCHSMSDLFGGTASVASKVFEVVSRPGFAQ